jgi:hypothetical protein
MEAATDPGTAWDDRRRGLTVEKPDRIGGDLDEGVRIERWVDVAARGSGPR